MRRSKPRDLLAALPIYMLTAFMAYNMVSFFAWQWRNPKANAMTCFTRYQAVITWQKLPEFQ